MSGQVLELTSAWVRILFEMLVRVQGSASPDELPQVQVPFLEQAFRHNQQALSP